jgi:uncharacterized protein (TIGR00106 family)
MRAIGEIQMTPVGTEVSMRSEVERAQDVLSRVGLKTEAHATGTTVEGELEQLLEGIRRIHEELHEAGVPRLTTNVRIETRTDKQPSIDESHAR